MERKSQYPRVFKVHTEQMTISPSVTSFSNPKTHKSSILRMLSKKTDLCVWVLKGREKT